MQKEYSDPIHIVEVTEDYLKTLNLDLPTIAQAVRTTWLSSQTAKQLGLRGNVGLKKINGKWGLIFKGYPGLRPNFPGTRYSLTNPKILTAGIGPIGAVKSTIRISYVGFVIAAGTEVLKYFTSDEYSLSKFAGNLTSTLTKLAISGAITAFIAAAATVVVPWVVGGLLVGLVVGVGAGIALNVIDNRYQVTERIIDALGVLDEYGGDLRSFSGRLDQKIPDYQARSKARKKLHNAPKI